MEAIVCISFDHE